MLSEALSARTAGVVAEWQHIGATRQDELQRSDPDLVDALDALAVQWRREESQRRRGA